MCTPVNAIRRKNLATHAGHQLVAPRAHRIVCASSLPRCLCGNVAMWQARGNAKEGAHDDIIIIIIIIGDTIRKRVESTARRRKEGRNEEGERERLMNQ